MHEPFECSLCEEGHYVLYESDKMCKRCGYISGSAGSETSPDPWTKWREIRNQKFLDGKVDRRKVVGSYVHAYPNYGRPD